MLKLERVITIAVSIFIFILPWQTRLIWHEANLNGFTWEYGRESLYGSEIFLWGLLALFVWWLIKRKKKIGFSMTIFSRQLKKPAGLLYWLTAALVLIAGVSVFWALDWQLALYHWVMLAEAGAIMALIMSFEIRLSTIASAWVTSSIIQSVFGIWQFFNQYTFANKWFGLAEHYPNVGGSIILQTDSERWLRAYGSLPHPNVLGGFLVIGLLFLFYLAFTATTSRQRIFILAGLICIVPALFFSFCRSAWIALLVCLLILNIWSRQQSRVEYRTIFYKLFFLMAMMAVILAVNLWQPLLTRLQGIEPLEVNSIQLRLTYTDQALTLILHNWFLGQGIGNYTLALYQQISSVWPGYYYQPVHNIYLLVWAELGIVGALLFWAMVFLAVWFAFRRPLTLERLTAFLVLAALLVIGLFDHYTWTLWSGVMMFFMVIGMYIRQLRSQI